MAGMGNKSSEFRLNLPRSDRQNQNRLVFDRRYGWVFDEWKDPAEEALAGGRGMFCVVPIAKGLIMMTSQSVIRAVESVAKILESSDQIPPPALPSAFINPWQKLMYFTGARKASNACKAQQPDVH